MRKTLGFVAPALILALVATSAPAAGDLPPMQVFSDDVNDGGLLYPDYELEAQDLIAGYISETEETIDFTWEVVDLPDGSGGLRELVHYYWEFTLDVAGDDKKPQSFSVRARAGLPGVSDTGIRANGDLRGNCTTTGNVVTCEPVQGAVVTVVVDDAANTVTAKVRRQDLKAGDASVAVDGAALDEAVLFRGIATFVGAGVVSSATGDEADMDGTYVLGTPR